jgi:excisionase family DNA binding protein
MEKRLLNITELSSFLNLKIASIYDLVYRKQIPYTKIGNRLRFDVGLIDKWLEAKTYIPFGVQKCYNYTQQVKGEEPQT